MTFESVVICFNYKTVFSVALLLSYFRKKCQETVKKRLVLEITKS